MRIFIDLDTGNIIQGPTIYNTITSLSFKRGPVIPIAVSFVKDGVVVELDPSGTAATGVFGVKQVGEYESAYVISSSTWVKTGTGENTVYTFSLSTNTDPLNTLLGITGTETSAVENDSVVLMGEVLWNTTIYGAGATPRFSAVVANNINQGFEGAVVAGGPVFNLAGAIAGQVIEFDGTEWNPVTPSKGSSLPQTCVAYADHCGDDSTGVVGTPTVAAKPFLTAQAAYNALVTEGGGVLKLGWGTDWGIALTADWPSTIGVQGVGKDVTALLINANGATPSSPGPGGTGFNVTLHSDHSVAISIEANGGDAVDPGDGSTSGGNAGAIDLTNVYVVNISASGGYGSDMSSGGSAGIITLTQCYCSGEIDAYGGGCGADGSSGNSGLIKSFGSYINYVDVSLMYGAGNPYAGTILGENSKFGTIMSNSALGNNGTITLNNCSYGTIVSSGSPVETFNSTYASLF